MLVRLLVLLVSAWVTQVQAQLDCENAAALHTQHLNGSITRADFESYLELPFQVPPGTRAIEVSFEYDREQRTTIDMGLLDPTGFRGWSGGNKSRFVISSLAATPSFQTGPLIPGTWHLLLGVPNIREGVTADYQASVRLDCESRPAGTVLTKDRGADWYRGDLHAHTGHSDGSCASTLGERVPCPLFRTLQTASARGLDFIAITDHNSVSQNAGNQALQRYFDQLLLIPGREVTTFYGHANVFGTTEFIDFRVQPEQGRDAGFLHRQVAELNALMSINHPGSPTGELCMGCGWTMPGTDFQQVTAIEVVNGGSVDNPGFPASIAFWERQLNAGHQLTAIGGSDNHDADRGADLATAIGRPTTWIHAPELSVRGILDGIRGGQVYVDVNGSGVRLHDLRVNGASMGDTVVGGGDLDLQAAWQGSAGLRPRWVLNGEPLTPQVRSSAAGDWRGRLDAAQVPDAGWLRMDLVDESGAVQLLGNPVYLTP